MALLNGLSVIQRHATDSVSNLILHFNIYEARNCNIITYGFCIL